MRAQLRMQHGVLALALAGALVTGLGLSGGAGPARLWHLGCGFALLALLGYHLLYLGVRGYVESSGWAAFPLRWGAGDWAAAREELRHLAGGAPARPEAGEYRVTQKALYWWVIGSTVALGLTGIAVAYWGPLRSLKALPALAAAHRGLGLLSAAVVFWHLYGVLTWEGRWWPEWSWLTGSLDAEKASVKVPGAYRLHLAAEAERAAEAKVFDPEQRARERNVLEAEQVQAELEKGNGLALEERYVEALHHYRRALELYPGYSQALYNMARVLALMGERGMARDTYRQFLDADPFHPLARKAQQAVRDLSEDGGTT